MKRLKLDDRRTAFRHLCHAAILCHYTDSDGSDLVYGRQRVRDIAALLGISLPKLKKPARVSRAKRQGAANLLLIAATVVSDGDTPGWLIEWAWLRLHGKELP